MFGIQPLAQSLAGGASGNVGWGGVVRYAGAVAIGASATAAALTWFYDTVKAQSGTSLDGYYSWTDYASVHINGGGFINGSAWRRWTFNTVPNNNSFYWDDTTNACGTDGNCIKAKIKALQPIYFQGIYANYVWVDGNLGNFSSWRSPVRPSLQNYESGNYPGGGAPKTDLAQGLATVMKRYAKEVLAPGGAPGLSYTPVPNANQFKTEAPFVAFIDTDGDGFSDVDELAAYPVSDPMDPQSKPATDPNANADGTCKSGYGRNPGVTACVPQALPTDPNANTDGTCKSGYSKPSGASTCTLTQSSDPNANENGSCKVGFFKPSGSTTCQPEQKTCQVGFKLVGADCVSDPLVLTPAPAFPDPLAPVQTAVNKFETDLKALKNVASTKFPFGFSSWIPTNLAVSGDCSAVITIEYGSLGTPSFDLCQIAGVQLAHNNIRPLLLLVLTVLFILMCSRIVGQS